MNAKTKHKVYFDFICNYIDSFTGDHSWVSMNMGSFSIDQEKLENIDTKSICEYIIKNKNDFLTNSYKNAIISIEYCIKAFKAYYLEVRENGNFICYASISNIRII